MVSPLKQLRIVWPSYIIISFIRFSLTTYICAYIYLSFTYIYSFFAFVEIIFLSTSSFSCEDLSFTIFLLLFFFFCFFFGFVFLYNWFRLCDTPCFVWRYTFACGSRVVAILERLSLVLLIIDRGLWSFDECVDQPRAFSVIFCDKKDREHLLKMSNSLTVLFSQCLRSETAIYFIFFVFSQYFNIRVDYYYPNEAVDPYCVGAWSLSCHSPFEKNSPKITIPIIILTIMNISFPMKIVNARRPYGSRLGNAFKLKKINK